MGLGGWLDIICCRRNRSSVVLVVVFAFSVFGVLFCFDVLRAFVSFFLEINVFFLLGKGEYR